jgi:hypothetical protein
MTEHATKVDRRTTWWKVAFGLCFVGGIVTATVSSAVGVIPGILIVGIGVGIIGRLLFYLPHPRDVDRTK